MATTRSLYRAADLHQDDTSSELSLWTTVPGAILLTAVGGLLAVTTSSSKVFDVAFVAVWVLAAVVTRRRSLGALLIWAPLVYAGSAIVEAARRSVVNGDPFHAKDLALALFDRLVLGAPALVITVVLMLVVSILRRPRHR